MPAASISLDEAVDLARTGDVWLFRGHAMADRAIQLATNSPVNHVGMSVAIEDLPPLMWHAELGRSLPDVWTGTRHRGVQLHDLREAVRQAAAKCSGVTDTASRASLRRMAVRPDHEGITEMNTRPNIVLVHGAWADGSCWSGVIERLQADGYHVTAPQFPLTALADDVTRLRQVLDLQDGPTIVAGHSYGGQVMTALGADAPNVAGLVYIAAFGLDQGESLGALLSQGPVTPALAHLFTDQRGFSWLSEDDFVNHFAGDVDPVRAKVMYAVQQPLATSAFGDVMGVPAWKTLPSWYLVAGDDQALPPDAERLFAARMGATTIEIPSSHVAMVSHPDEVAQLIKTAAEAGSATT